ncbi:hypothetical protein BDN70DRAFT_799913 [Pholiota conissans]|uniref:Uncharacterized protein n=1 Tax=Pholiota conissans TaxID=109636 RepID=A0A9P5ZCF7_9AGAR|nr:hypothetical protein BDN70DRAFT_799913 [Pholiota conissans]
MQRFSRIFTSSLLLIATLVSLASSSTPSITSPSNGTSINPGDKFTFSYHSIADYGTSSYNYTVWLFTTPPSAFVPFKDYASGYYFGRYASPNYPGNPNPSNPPPATLTMPNFARLRRGVGSGSHARNATVYLAVLEEYITGESLGYRISLVYNHIFYNGTYVVH